MSRWADAAERIGGSGMSYNEMRRRDPVGGASTSPHHSRQTSLITDSLLHEKTASTAQFSYDVFINKPQFSQQNSNEGLPTISPNPVNEYQDLPPDHPLLQGHTRTKSIDANLSDRQYDERSYAHHERSHSHDSFTQERFHNPNNYQFKNDPQAIYSYETSRAPVLQPQNNDVMYGQSTKHNDYTNSSAPVALEQRSVILYVINF